MDRERLRHLDLNLLLAFDALVAECNVTKAAARMSVGQPAMSASLSRLRRFFDDPLLVRDGQSMVPTNRARGLIGPIRDALDAIESTVGASREFDPRTDHRTFMLMASDYVLLLLLGPLLADLWVEAPNVHFTVRPIAPDLFEQIDRSQLDLLIYPEDLVPKGVRVRSARLFTDRFVCAVDRDHPDVGERLTEEQFLTLPFVAFDGAGMRTVSELRFIETGIDRSVEIGTQSFVSQPLMLPGTRLMALVYELLGKHFVELVGIRLIEPPFDFRPSSQAMFWSPRADGDPAHKWLRDRVRRAASALHS
jgi:DNA-binding transcriptional LysR family regulator